MSDQINTLPRAIFGNAAASPPGTAPTGTPLYVGTLDLAGLLYTDADVSDPSLSLFLADATQALHITDKGARATDWGVTNNADPTVYIHSNTTPTTDYLLLGNHNGTQAQIAAVGGTLDITAVGSIVFNEASADVDIRMESNANANFWVLDSSANLNGCLSIGGVAPTNPQAMLALLPQANATGITTNQSYFHQTLLPGGATTIPAGTAPVVASLNIHEPNITATGTVTDAATVRIVDAPTEGGTNWALWVDAGATRLDGTAYIGDTSNADTVLGLTINQAGNDDVILALKSSDVGHGFTTVLETDTYASFKKLTAATGGLDLSAFEGTAAVGLRLRGAVGAATATRSTVGTAPVMIDAALKSGTDVATVGADKNLLAIRDNGTTRFVMDSDGDSFQDVGTAWTNFDDHEDADLLTDLSIAVSRDGDPIKEQFGDFLRYNREHLERVKLVTFNEDGHHFVNMSRLTMLLVGAVRQASDRLAAVEGQLAAALQGGNAKKALV